MNDPELIDIKDYVIRGEGATALLYENPGDPDIVVKLYAPSYPTKAIYGELAVAKKVFELGIPSPEPGTLVTDGTRLGLKFRKVPGKRSYSRAVQQEPERCGEFAREFAGMCKKLHAMVLPKGTFPASKVRTTAMLQNNPFLTDTQRSAILAFLDTVPDADNALHGDLHMGNVISTLAPGEPLSTPHELYFIDLGFFGQGYPLLDIAINNFICNYLDEETRIEQFHLTLPDTQRFWNYFVEEYFFGEERLADKYFGPGATREDVDRAMLKYTAMRMGLISLVLGRMNPSFAAIIREAFGE